MRIDTLQRNVEIVGDIQEFKTSIDPKNIDFITTLLSSNLYSDPEQSFIREIVSNAWDSHIEANTTNVPIIIKFNKSEDNRSITIRDYGTGISPERFREIYCNIGSSTKRESNDFTGGFGIGKYSALACSNSVYITSYYNKIAYYYVMIKSGNTITTNLLMESPTTEDNGVEVTIKNIENFESFDKALKCILFFPNIYIVGAKDADAINNSHIRKFNNFAVSSIPVDARILLGNVLYPIQSKYFDSDIRNFIYSLTYTGIVIKFNIGELEITPNRENIIYNSNTIKLITDRVAAAKQELINHINKHIVKDYNNIIDYFDNLTGRKGYDFINDKITLNDTIHYGINIRDNYSECITYKGVNLKSEYYFISDLIYHDLPNFKGFIADNKIYVKRVPWNIRHAFDFLTDKVLILNSGARLTETARSYIIKNYNNHSIITEFSEQEFINWINNLNSLNKVSNNKFLLIVKGLYEALLAKSVKLDINNDHNFIKYKSEFKTLKSSNKNFKDTILYVVNRTLCRERFIFKSLLDAVDYIKSFNRGIILTEMNADDQIFSAIATLKSMIFIKARKDIIEKIRKLNLKCVVDNNWLLYKDPMLSVVKTIDKYFPKDFINNSSLCDYIDENLAREFTRLAKINNTWNYSNYYKKLALRDTIKIDPYTEYLCLVLKKYLSKYIPIKDLVNNQDTYDKDLITAAIIRTKAFRVNNRVYKKMKTNKLLNILCKK